MNKKIVAVIVILLISVSMSYKAQAASSLDSICLYIADDDKNRLRKMIKTSRSKVKNLYKDIKCNGMNILRFAMKRKADKSGAFMVKKISISLLKKGGDIAWASENGLADSVTAQAINKRIGS